MAGFNSYTNKKNSNKKPSNSPKHSLKQSIDNTNVGGFSTYDNQRSIKTRNTKSPYKNLTNQKSRSNNMSLNNSSFTKKSKKGGVP